MEEYPRVRYQFLVSVPVQLCHRETNLGCFCSGENLTGKLLVVTFNYRLVTGRACDGFKMIYPGLRKSHYFYHDSSVPKIFFFQKK